MRTNRITKKTKLGFALVFVLGFAALMAVFTAAIGARARFNLNIAEKRGKTGMSRYASMTGTQLALSMVREPTIPDWLYNDGAIAASLPAANADAIAHVYHNITALPNHIDNAPDGTAVPVDGFYIISVGVVDPEYDGDFNLVGGTIHEAVTMGSSLVPSFPTMPQAAFAFGPLTINGEVDHFNSNVVPFAADPFGSDPAASVATAGTSATDITLGTSASVDGDLMLGDGAPDNEVRDLADSISPSTPRNGTSPPSTYAPPGHHASPKSKGTDKISGQVTLLAVPKEIPQMEPRPERINYTLSNSPHSGTLVLEEGSTYHQLGNFVLNSGSVVQVNDSNGDGDLEDTIILVENDITINNSQVNLWQAPRRLKLFSYAKDGASNISVTNNSTVSALIAGGPGVTTTIESGSVIWGAVMGDAVTNDGTIHYDVNLRDPMQLADIYGLYVGGVVVSSGSIVGTGALAAPQAVATTTGTTTATTTATTTTATTTTATTTTATTTATTTTGTTTGCGCCGCGSMMMAMKAKEAVAAY